MEGNIAEYEVEQLTITFIKYKVSITETSVLTNFQMNLSRVQCIKDSRLRWNISSPENNGKRRHIFDILLHKYIKM